MECREYQFNCMYDWDYSHQNVLELKYEDMVLNPYQFFLEAFGFLELIDNERYSYRKWVKTFFYRSFRALEGKMHGKFTIPFSPKRLHAESLLGIVWANDFSKKTGGRQRGEEDLSSHYRKGQAGDWRNPFNPHITAEFKQHYNPLLIKSGYEEESDWR